jgi:predicted GIY-YIG superfamily endonuclease
MPGAVYLLHFSPPLAHARHYLGWTPDLARRLEDHQTGRGARITQVATERGITLHLTRTWPGDRHLERHLKRRKDAPRLCPICRAELRGQFDPFTTPQRRTG